MPEPSTKSSIVNTQSPPNNKISLEQHFIIAYPNPANQWITFEYTLPSNVENAVILVTNIYGKTVKVISLKNNSGQVLWDIRNIISGVYIYCLKIENSIIERKQTIIAK